jgi:N4-gp56 family major capsid protein
MGVTTTSVYGTVVDKFFHRRLLKRAKPRFVFNNFGQVRMMPQKNTSRLAFRRQENLNSDPVVLTEGVSPAFDQVFNFDVEVELQQYGKVVALSDKVIISVEDDTAVETADNLNQAMHGMLDKVTRDTLASTATRIQAANGVNGNAITEVTQDDAELALDYLYQNDAEKMAPVIEGQNRFGTAPIDEAYWVLSDVDMRQDWKALESFIPTGQYPSQMSVLQAEFGAIDEGRIVLSSQGSVDLTTSPATYNNFFVSNGFYAHSGIDEVAAEMIIKELGQGDDALNQRQTMGFKAFFGALVLDDNFGVNLQTTLA